MGYFEIGIYRPKYKDNIGTLWRTAYQLGASSIFTIEHRYKGQPGDTPKTPRHIPLRHYKNFDDFLVHLPNMSTLVGIEFGGIALSQFTHPKQCTYLLGAEDSGLPDEIQSHCKYIVSLEAVARPSYNVAVAGGIVLYDRCFGY